MSNSLVAQTCDSDCGSFIFRRGRVVPHLINVGGCRCPKRPTSLSKLPQLPTITFQPGHNLQNVAPINGAVKIDRDLVVIRNERHRRDRNRSNLRRRFDPISRLLSLLRKQISNVRTGSRKYIEETTSRSRQKVECARKQGRANKLTHSYKEHNWY
jgi:hypothetical protein